MGLKTYLSREAEEQVMANRWRKDAMDFKGWWDNGVEGDPFFEEKKTAKCRGIKQHVIVPHKHVFAEIRQQ